METGSRIKVRGTRGDSEPVLTGFALFRDVINPDEDEKNEDISEDRHLKYYPCVKPIMF